MPSVAPSVASSVASSAASSAAASVAPSVISAVFDSSSTAVKNVDPRLFKLALIADLDRRRENEIRTWQRKVHLAIGAVFVLFCIAFLVSVTYTILRPRDVTYNVTYDNASGVTLPMTSMTPVFENFSDMVRSNVSVHPLLFQEDIADGLRYTAEERKDSDLAPRDSGSKRSFCDTDACRVLAKKLEEASDPGKDPCQSTSTHDRVCPPPGNTVRGYLPGAVTSWADDELLRSYEAGLIHAIKNGGYPLKGIRRFLSACEDGIPGVDPKSAGVTRGLLNGNQSFEKFLDRIVSVAEIGIEAFFSVHVVVTEGVVNVVLGPSSPFLGVRSSVVDNATEAAVRAVGLLYGVRFNVTDIMSIDDDVRRSAGACNDSALLLALTTRLCPTVANILKGKRRCRLRHSGAPIGKLRRWYQTSGTQYLAFAVATDFLPLVPPTESNKRFLQLALSYFYPRDAEEAHAGRAGMCLRLIERHDPYSLAYVGRSISPPWFETNARYLLRLLKTSTRVDNVSWSLFHPDAFYRGRFISEYNSEVYDDLLAAVAIQEPNVLEYFGRSRRTSWKRGFEWKRGTLRAKASIEYPSLSLEIPLPVFNFKIPDDPWFRLLELARVGPRVLHPLFERAFGDKGVPRPLKECVGNLSAGLGTRGFRNASAEDGAAVLASFYVSLLAFRSVVGEHQVVAGTALDSGGMFLAYYARNLCERRGRSHRAADSLSRARFQVDLPAAAFGHGLKWRPDCAKVPSPSVCDSLDAKASWWT